MENEKVVKILIIEDAEGIAKGYKTILNSNRCYEITICNTGLDAQKLIDCREIFELAIVDIMVPVEDHSKYNLNDGQETGLRLIKNMISQDICNRFYVITVLGDIQDSILKICKGRALLKCEDKLDYKPEALLSNVNELLNADLPSADLEIVD